MSSTLRGLAPSRTGTDDIYFEPIDLSDAGFIKQDLTSEDGFPQDSLEERRRKSWIGAYRGTKDGLPAEKGFPIQIGSELFRLSGASIMSDAPSYFSKFFEEQLNDTANNHGNVRTLFIDRDPETFRDIARHLQGYYVYPRDGQHYVRLFSDAQFYSLSRLNKQLFNSEIYISIGDQDFKIPKDIFSAPGDSPNFFSLGFATFFNHPDEPFPGLDREGLIRPPPVEAPRLQGHSASTFADLLQLLRGYPLEIRGADHRAELLQDCRYYQFRGLEQKLISHKITYLPESQDSEILLRIEDLRQSGFSIVPGSQTSVYPSGRVRYARPYTDTRPHNLVVEIANDSTILDFGTATATFSGQMKNRAASLMQVIYTKFAATEGTMISRDDRMEGYPFEIDAHTHITLDGQPFELPQKLDGWENSGPEPPLKKLKLQTVDTINKSMSCVQGQWIVRRGQWRLGISSTEDPGSGRSVIVIISLHAVKLDATSGPNGRNKTRDFLSG